MSDYEGDLTAEELFEAMERDATPAEADLEDKLLRLDAMAAQRRKDPDLEKRYEALRDEVAEELKATGPRYYLDEHGLKRYAFRVAPEKVEVDVEELVRQVEAGEIEVDLDKVAPRKVDAEQLKRAVAKGSRPANRGKPGVIPPEKFLKMARRKPGTAHVRFSDPRDDQ